MSVHESDMIAELRDIDVQFKAILQPEARSYVAERVGVAAASLTIGVASLTAPAGAETHTIGEGEVLGVIAQDHGTSIAALKAVNNIENEDRIYAGDTLEIPYEEIEVREGDTLWGFARAHYPDAGIKEVNAFTNELKRINNTPDGKILTGQIVRIPVKDQQIDAEITLAKGDSPHSIAQKLSPNDTPAEEVAIAEKIIQDNDVKVVNDKAVLREGDKLRVPVISESYQSATAEVGHTVASATENSDEQPEAPAMPPAPEVTVQAIEQSQAKPLIVEKAKPEAKPAELQTEYDYSAIPEIQGVDKELIQEVTRYLIEKHGLTVKGAAYLTGNFLQESNLDPNAVGDSGTAHGIAQWRFERLNGMPRGDLFKQIDFAMNTEMDRDGIAADLDELLKDPNATDAQIQDGLKRWERWGHEGNRFAYGEQIEEAITVEQVEVPVPTPVIVEQKKVEAPAHPHQAIIDEFKLAHPLIDTKSIQTGVAGKKGETITVVEVMGVPVGASIANDLARMVEAAKADGFDLGITSGHRSHEKQADLRVQNDCPDIHESSASACRVPTARPGESNHNGGEAVDLNRDGNSIDNETFAWLQANARKFGFKNLPGEPWHWSRNGR